MAPKLYVTTAHKYDAASESLARQCSEILGVPYIPRLRRPLEEIVEQDVETGFLIISKNLELTLFYQGHEFFFHPSMSKVRIKGLKKGQQDPMLTAMKVGTGDRILDCTLGLGSDAIVASFAVGEKGKVVGVESVPVIALITKYGFKHYQDKSNLINQLIRPIEVVNCDYLDYLRTLPDNSFDVVYFDPMFRNPLRRSNSMEPMRAWANPAPLSREAVREALRVASKRVVMKENSISDEFDKLGFSEVIGGKYSPVSYGIIEV